MAGIAKTVGKLTAPMMRRIHSMVVRGVVKIVNDAGGLQLLQVSGIDGELLDGVERVQNYGFSSHPKAGAQAVILAVGGSRTHSLVLAVDDGRVRPTNSKEGEVLIYDDQNQKIHLTREGIVIESGALPVTIKSSTKVRIETPILECTGDIIDNVGAASSRSMAAMRSKYNAHGHTGDSGGPTSTPNEVM